MSFYICNCIFFVVILPNKLRGAKMLNKPLVARYMYNNMYGDHWGDHRRRRFGDFRSQSFCQVTAPGSRQGAFMECQTCYNLYGQQPKNLSKNYALGSEGEILYVFLFFQNFVSMICLC